MDATRRRRRVARPAVLAGVLSASALVLVPAGTPAQKKSKPVFQPGTYKGKTVQENVGAGFRNVEFEVSRKGRVTLITEPVVRREFCTTAPVFTLEGETPTKPLSGRGAFSFTKTFEGTKIDRIKGKFVTPTRIEGTAVYNFQASDLCSEGATKVEFTAAKQTKKKKG
jgi:hypothetical protein